MKIKSKKEFNLDDKDKQRMLDDDFKFDTWYKVIEKIVYHFNNGIKKNFYKLEGINSFVKESMFCETQDVDKDINIRNLFERDSDVF